MCRTASVLVGRLPLFISDGLAQYEVLLESRHIDVPYPRTGQRGRPCNPQRLPAPELRYAQVVKQREGRRIVSVTRRVVYGNPPQEIDPRQITTSLIERLNLTFRQENASLTRKTLAFGKNEEEMRAHLALQIAYYDFVRPHSNLRRRLARSIPVRGRTSRYWEKRTPAMAASITDRVWTLRELLSYRPAIKATD